jgi:hypothetical protein
MLADRLNLAEQAKTNPAAFMTLLGKVLPPEPRRGAARNHVQHGTKDIRPPEMKDVTPAIDERRLQMARLPALDDE